MLREALQRTDLRKTDFWVLGHGEGRDVPARSALARERTQSVR